MIIAMMPVVPLASLPAEPAAPVAPSAPGGPWGPGSAYSPSGRTGRRAQIKVALYRAGHPAARDWLAFTPPTMNVTICPEGSDCLWGVGNCSTCRTCSVCNGSVWSPDSGYPLSAFAKETVALRTLVLVVWRHGCSQRKVFLASPAGYSRERPAGHLPDPHQGLCRDGPYYR